MLIYLLYRVAAIPAFPLTLLYLAWRGLRDRRYFTNLWERFGFLPAGLRQPAPGAVWLHAVSVGEVLSSIELMRQLRARMPGRKVFVSSTTLAGRGMAAEKLAGLADGVFYAPLDFAFAVRSMFRVLRPSVLVVLETEIWPNLWREAGRHGAGLVVVNARLSDRRYSRYRALRWFFGPVLGLPSAILASNEIAAARYRELGAPPGKVHVAGNLKYDFRLPASAPAEIGGFLEKLRPERVWIAASTMPPRRDGDIDEDEAVLAAFLALAPRHPRLLLIHVPRRPELFETAARKFEAAGVPLARRSRLDGAASLDLPGVLLLDTMGEMASLFPLADVVFMGGTLADRGGHNILEPAFAGKPVVVGPHMENFPDIAEEFHAAGAMVRIGTAADLAPAIERVLAAPGDLGERARRLAESKRGATARAVHAIEDAWSQAIPRRPQSRLAAALLYPLALAWEAGAAWKRSRHTARAARLSTPVIGVGGLAMGGVGKTPLVLHLAGRLREAGLRPAILTRGYRRRSPERCTLLEPGSSCPTARTGDEAQLLLRAGVAPIGIGADRAAVGRLVEERFHPGVILLDDGFQHWRLARDLDIVLIDTLDPLGGGVFPLGRLREPLDALARAGAVVLTRTLPGAKLAGIEALVRRYNPTAPVFYSRAVPRAWIDAATGARTPVDALRAGRPAAFCGLGNPAAFWRTLEDIGHSPVLRWEFGDHAAYRPAQVRRLRHQAAALGADALLTTEKDMVNLPEPLPPLLDGLPLYALEVGVEIDNEEDLLRLLKTALPA